MSEKRKRLKLDPDLTDGEHFTIHDDPNEVLLGLIEDWMADNRAGATIEIKLVEMTDEECAALPDI